MNYLYKHGDRVRIIKLSDDMPTDVKVGDVLTVIYYYAGSQPAIRCKEMLPSDLFSIDHFELVNELKPGLFFKKDNDIYLVAESINQRWMVNLSTGIASWSSTNNLKISTTLLEAKGYVQIEVSKDIFNVIARVNS